MLKNLIIAVIYYKKYVKYKIYVLIKYEPKQNYK